MFLFPGMACFFIVFIMSLQQYDLQDTAKTLTWIFMIFPHFALVIIFNSQLCIHFCSKYVSGSESWAGQYQHDNGNQSSL